MLNFFRLSITAEEFINVSAIELDRIYRYCVEHCYQDLDGYHKMDDLPRMIHQLVLSQPALTVILNQFERQISEEAHQSGQESMRSTYCD